MSGLWGAQRRNHELPGFKVSSRCSSRPNGYIQEVRACETSWTGDFDEDTYRGRSSCWSLINLEGGWHSLGPTTPVKIGAQTSLLYIAKFVNDSLLETLPLRTCLQETATGDDFETSTIDVLEQRRQDAKLLWYARCPPLRLSAEFLPVSGISRNNNGYRLDGQAATTRRLCPRPCKYLRISLDLREAIDDYRFVHDHQTPSTLTRAMNDATNDDLRSWTQTNLESGSLARRNWLPIK